MMRKLYRNITLILSFAAVLSAAVSCNEKPHGMSVEANRFLDKREPGLVKGKNYKIVYTESSWQMVRNQMRNVLRLQSDGQQAYLNMKMEEKSVQGTQEEYKVNVVLTYRTGKNAPEITESLEMEILKSHQMRMWLWNEEQKTGVIVPL